jgi:hypothetical protein
VNDPERRATAAVGHMPFPGHRTCKTIRLQQEAARKREQGRKTAMEYGFDPGCIEAGR